MKTMKKKAAAPAAKSRDFSSQIKKYPHGDLVQFQKDRFGMFIHWGVYSMYGVNEWARRWFRISEEDYQFLIDNFEPDLFNPSEWAKAAKAAGMKYVVIVTKHHDGFCMWDSARTDYKITNSPCKRDLLKEIVAAFRAEGVVIGFYYSVTDWHHPDFTIDEGGNHALDNLSKEEIAKLNKKRDMRRYAKYMRDQVTELLTQFGEVRELWFDVSGKIDPVACESEAMLKLVRKLSPKTIINNRLFLKGAEDILTPEGYARESECLGYDGKPHAWEGCQCLSAAWGYNRDEKSYFHTSFRFLETLITNTSLGGNTLFNIGPTSRGFLCAFEQEKLSYFANWMKFNSRSIYNCGKAPEWLPAAPRDTRYTYNPELKRLYVHLVAWASGGLILHGLAGKVRYAQMLWDGTRIETSEGKAATIDDLNPRVPEGAVCFRLMSPPENMPIPVIEVFLKD